MNGLRWAEPSEAAPLARMWRAAWRDGHAGIVPQALVDLRSAALFERRVQEWLPMIRVAGPLGDPQGLCIVEGDRLYQLFVAAEARGTGLARRLIEEAEARMIAAGVGRARLTCAAGNDRAAAFYRRQGWTVARAEVTLFGQDTGAGVPVLAWIFEKRL